MATVPMGDSGDARGEMDRLFAEMPGAPAALVLVVATRGRLGYVGPRNDPSYASAEETVEGERKEVIRIVKVPVEVQPTTVRLTHPRRSATCPSSVPR